MMPPDLAAAVRALGRRAGPKDVMQVIAKLCAWRPQRPSDLAAILNRNAKYIRDQYLGPMREAGELEFTKSDPADPNQEYRIVPLDRRQR